MYGKEAVIIIKEEYQLKQFYSGLEALGITCSEKQIHQFLTFYEMLTEKNKVMNLTAITEFQDVIEKHFLDSLSLAENRNLNQKLKVIDLGTGAGFPGIPLKIAFPELELVLMDSLNKRILFLKEVIEELGLSGITAVHGRAEEMAVQPDYREKFDLCVSRAVANLASLSEYCIPFVKVGGNFVSYKSAEVKEEVQQQKRRFMFWEVKLLTSRNLPYPVQKFPDHWFKLKNKRKRPKVIPESQERLQNVRFVEKQCTAANIFIWFVRCSIRFIYLTGSKYKFSTSSNFSGVSN